MHETVRANIIGRIHASPAADPRDRKELIETALAGNKATHEATAIPAEKIVDEIIKIAYLHHVSLMVVEHRQDLLNRYDGIAAVTYPHSPEA